MDKQKLLKTYINQLNAITERVCDELCKYREMDIDTDELIDTVCVNCPLGLLTQ